MTDMPHIDVDDAQAPAACSPEPGVGAKAPQAPSKKKSGVSPAQVLMVAAGVATLAWGAWMTRSVMDLQATGEPQFVKVQLQGLVGEYIKAQARSATAPDKVSAETGAFMAELDKAVKGLSAEGKIVLINEAIVAGDVPDVTEAVRRQVYAKVPVPKQAAAQDVESAMRNYLLGAGAPGNAAASLAANGAVHGLGN
ncbi:hypothetical protein HNO88_003877 [Novosphingobium chloroacetimidivorans]|uniref:Uncharacterized protein n=1 Tax=Novosphingobium chloroacetimidivorans TaxID=1428314 RepID=A0A7W7KE46_9SPHN|nr:TrbI F-type domain-containing protein [Novosphingobium chloroacetimidivorans]MBB4860533.1 hypothetical protein [Novosphingobium chloroacetimidivorans]